MNIKIVKAKQFRLPVEELLLNEIYNNPEYTIENEQVFQDRTEGNVIVFLKYFYLEQAEETADIGETYENTEHLEDDILYEEEEYFFDEED